MSTANYSRLIENSTAISPFPYFASFMAPAGESCYFPPLDRCLDGRHQLFSWKTTYIGLSQLGEVPENSSLQKHITDRQTIDLLTRPFSPYSPPTPQSKSYFETKTSAINVLPSAQGRYNIKEIQDDTKWLSATTNINEIEALRIAVLEWQTRPAERLLLDNPHDDAADYRKTLSFNGLAASFNRSTQTRTLSSDQDASSTFDSAEARRDRLLSIYLSERRYILKTSEYLLSVAISEAAQPGKLAEPSSASKSKGKAPERSEKSDWIEEVGNDICAIWNVDGLVEDRRENFIVTAVNALQFRVDSTESGSGWFEQEPRDIIEAAWARNQWLEMIHIMEAMLTLLNFSTNVTRCDSLVAWFRFVAKYSFFQQNGGGFQDLEVPLQSLVALISLALLKVPRALEMILQISSGALSATNAQADAPFLLDPEVITEITDILTAAASEALATASLAIFAWGIILQTIRDYAAISRESRELRQFHRTVDRYGMADGFDAGRSTFRRTSPIQRRSSASSESSQQLSFLEDITDRIMAIATEDHDPIRYLANCVIDQSQVFNVLTTLAVGYCNSFGSDNHGKAGLRIRRMLLELVSAALDSIEYEPTLVITSLAILTGNERYWDILNRSQDLNKSEPASAFLLDDLLMQKLLQVSLNRFPFETLPFLKLCRALAISNTEDQDGALIILSLLRQRDSLTCPVPTDFTAYEIIGEEDDASYIQLTGDLSFLTDCLPLKEIHSGKSSQSSWALMKPAAMQYSQLPIGSTGRVISESKPLVVVWAHDYSPLTYLGTILNTFSTEHTVSLAATELREIVSETISLLATLISAATRHALNNGSAAVDAAKIILEIASDGLGRGQDIISLILNIFENELHRHPGPSGEEGALDILRSCIQFIHALVLVMPDRVWPFLGRSSLLGIDGSESQLNALIAAHEIVSGRYDFLLGCIHVFDALIDDAISRAVSHKIPPAATKRFAGSVHGAGVSQTGVEKVIINLQRTMIDVFESSFNWKFTIQQEGLEINTWICTIFEKILGYYFDLEGSKLANPLAIAADGLLTSFLSTSGGNVTINPLLRILDEGVVTPNTSLSLSSLLHWTAHVKAVLRFSASLIRVNTLLKRPESHFQREIFKATAVLTKIYAVHESYRLPAVELIDALICSIDSTDEQPPSLLGHLGRDTASYFLELLSIVDQPFSNDTLSIGIWRLLSGIVSRRQQWFAIFVLTGNTPRESFKESGKINGPSSQRAEPLLTIALDGLSNIERLEPNNAIAMLEFIALGADYWPWALAIIDEHPRFLTAMAEFIASLNSGQIHANAGSSNTSEFIRLQISSVILNIFAMYINYTQQIGNLAFAKRLFPSLTYVTQYAVSVPGYNVSLHTRLRHNFMSKFVGCSIDDFKWSTKQRRHLGRNFYYNIEIANKMLAFDPAWAGKRGQGFADELERANINLSLVESQVNLFRSWKFLAVELSKGLGTDAKFQNIMVSIIVNCLHSNATSKLPEAIFDRLNYSRAELAFTLLQRLIELKSHDGKLRDIFPVAWDTLHTHQSDVGMGLTGENADYYRILLKILCLSLSAHTFGIEADDLYSNRDASASPSTVEKVMDVIGVVVARGFRSLTTLLHEDTTRIFPSDFSLLIAIFRTSLRIPGIGKQTTRLVEEFSSYQTARCACALLSWADQLAIDDDPVYGEISVSFLLELSSIQALAELLAVDGILTRISSANLIKYLRQDNGVGPFDTPPRLYGIWSRGILPLLLNLLHGVGAPVAIEIAASLGSFPGQLSRASKAFEGKQITSADLTAGAITLSMVSEAQTLAVITSVLETFREAGPSVGIDIHKLKEVGWARSQVRDDIDSLLQRRSVLRDSLFPLNEREEELMRQPPQGRDSSAENRLEEKIVGELRTIVDLLGGGEP